MKIVKLKKSVSPEYLAPLVRKIATALVGAILLLAVYFLGMTQGYYGKITANNYSAVFRQELQHKSLGKTDFSLFWEVASKLQEKYFGEFNAQNMVYGSIKGLVAALGDPYTMFNDPTENKQFFDTLNGTYEGVGLELDVVNGTLVVVAPLKDSPAEAAGFKPRDVVVAINNETVTGMSFSEVLAKIKGPAGTSVTLTVTREGVKAPMEIKVNRAKIKRDSVSVEIGDDKIAVIKIVRFGNDTNVGFDQAVNKVIASGAKGVVLDLRSNPGGFLDAGVKVANEFIKSGVVVVERMKNGDQTAFSADGTGRLLDIPLVVLVNKGSASASEIVAGALQDHSRAKVVGTTTFGKGSVQEVEDFADGSALKVTVARWYTPDGKSISDNGVKPDKEVQIKPEDKDDVQMIEAKKLLGVR